MKLTPETLMHTTTRLSVAGVLIFGVWLAVNGISSAEFTPPPRPQVVTLLDQPVEPPEPVETKPEPELVEMPEPIQQVEIHKLSEMDVVPMDDLLGLDADASAGLDGFGLVAKRGGADILKTSGAPHSRVLARLSAEIEQHVAKALSRKTRLLKKNYTIQVSVWLTDSGFVDRVELMNSTGAAQLDAALKAALRNISPFAARVVGVPQPVRLRITTRGARSA